VGQLPMTIENTIDKLKEFDKTLLIKLANGPIFELISWRGSYSEMTLGGNETTIKTVGECINYLESELGKDKFGYKGGTFVVHKDCTLWADRYALSAGLGVATVVQKDDYVDIVVSEFDW